MTLPITIAGFCRKRIWMSLRHRWRLPAGYRMRWDWSNAPFPVDGLPVQLDRVT
jgi:hypothetical protein